MKCQFGRIFRNGGTLKIESMKILEFEIYFDRITAQWIDCPEGL